MCGFLLRIIINALVLFLVVVNLPGVFVDTLGAALLGAAVIGLANAAIRPFIAFAQLRLSGVTLGGVTFLTNIFAPFMLVEALPGFQIYGALSPIAGIFVMTVCSVTLTKVIHDR